MSINYKLMNDPIKGTLDSVIKKTVDGVISFIPTDEANTDYQKNLEWAKTNTAEAAE